MWWRRVTSTPALRFCVENKLNMIVSGGTSTGKTVAARKILSLIPPEERIITIEEAAELRPEQPNAVTLIADRDTEARSEQMCCRPRPCACGQIVSCWVRSGAVRQ